MTRLDVLFMNHISCLANLFQFQRLKLMNNVEICKTCPNFESVYDTRSGNKTIQRLSTNCQKNARQKCTTGDYILLLLIVLFVVLEAIIEQLNTACDYTMTFVNVPLEFTGNILIVGNFRLGSFGFQK